MEEKYEDTSQFNEGIAILKRIDKLRTAIHESRYKGNFNLWFMSLCGWREELTSELSDEEEKECNKYEQKIHYVISASPDIAFNILQQYGRYLAKLHKSHGYGMPDKDDDEGL